ncbi:conserved hypothetical protein [Rubrivivax sp. A210]|uniref:hypothetical protein n=1 Tax=Rubrivivax sp. A210 TaxID=2772301 RepID=UPI00191A3F0B|nr:hypothetical protein [Rubrivivax sp. A210]CAD5375180.1 conserved hypothetical protein [Rubrivivax sp. A210]
MFGARRRLRSLARIMLAVWLFALGAGSVHGCVVGHELSQGAAATPCRVAPAVDELSAAFVHEAPPAHAANPSCEKFCEVEAAGVPSASAAAQTAPAAAAAVVWMAPPPALSLAVQAALHAPPAPRQSGPAGAGARIPVAIAFLRLTR